MLVFILVMFGLFILGVFVFIAANAGRGREDWNSYLPGSDSSTTPWPMTSTDNTEDCRDVNGNDSDGGCGADAGDSGGSDGGGGDGGGGD